MKCPLCNSEHFAHFFDDRLRSYNRCHQCQLIFVPENYRPDRFTEKAEYDLHQNSPEDVGYRRFLSRLFQPLCGKLHKNCMGLDFGCGPGPTLSLMLEEAGHSMDIYDKFYFDHPEVFEKQYDFITATEVIEHIFEPRTELMRLLKMLKPGGFLALMTKLARGKDAFSKWHYKDDITHVCFYSRDTFLWMSEEWGLNVEFVGNDVIILQKKVP